MASLSVSIGCGSSRSKASCSHAGSGNVSFERCYGNFHKVRYHRETTSALSHGILWCVLFGYSGSAVSRQQDCGSGFVSANLSCRIEMAFSKEACLYIISPKSLNWNEKFAFIILQNQFPFLRNINQNRTNCASLVLLCLYSPGGNACCKSDCGQSLQQLGRFYVPEDFHLLTLLWNTAS